MSNILPEEKEQEFVSIHEAARILGVSTKTLRRWDKQGRLTSLRTPGDHRRYPLTQIKNFKEQRDLRPIQKALQTNSSFSKEAPVLFKSLHSNQKRVLVGLWLGFLLALDLGLLASLEKYQSVTNANKTLTGKVLQAATTLANPKFFVNVPTLFRDEVTFETGITASELATFADLEIGGTLTLTEDLDVPGSLNLSGNTLTSAGDLIINPSGGGTSIGTGTADTIDLAGGDLYVTADLEVDGILYGNASGLTNLPTGDATTLDSIDSSSFLRSDTSDSYTSGTLSFSASTFLDLSAITQSSATLQGFRLPQATALTNLGSGEGFIAWDTDDNSLRVFDGTAWVSSFSGITGTGAANQITFWSGTGTIAGDTGLTYDSSTDILSVISGGKINPTVNLGSDLGTPLLKWNNIYAANLTLDSGFTSSGQLLVTYNPIDTTFAESSIRVNVTTPAADEQMLGIGQAGEERAAIDAEGDLTIGYDGIAGSSVPANSNLLSIYGHGTTEIFSIATTGNISTANQTIDWTLNSAADALNFDTNTLSIDALNNRVGIGNASPAYSLTIGTADATAMGNMYLGATNGTTEGGQIDWEGASTNDNWITDLNLQNFRIFTNSANTNQVQIFNNSTGIASLSVEGEITFEGGTTQQLLHDTYRDDKGTPNNSLTEQVVRKGWDYATGVATSISTSVTYGITYDDIPIVIATRAGTKTTAGVPANLSACNSGAYYLEKSQAVYSVTTTGFSWTVGSPSGAYTANDSVCFTWTATGTYAAGADLAEYYKSSEKLEVGDVVSISRTEDKKIVKSTGKNDIAVVGIISSQPGLVLGNQDGKSSDPDSYPVALAGRVPVKVSLENGVVERGDLLTPSSVPGVAMKLVGAGPVVGKAMERFDATQTVSTNPNDPDLENLESGFGKIMVFVNTSWYGGENTALNPSAEILLQTSQLTASDSASLNTLTVLGTATLGDTLINGNLQVGTIKIDNLENSLDAIGTLKLQPLALGNLEIMNGYIKIDTKGNLYISDGQIIGNDSFRGSEILPAGKNTLRIERTWDSPPATINLTPNYNTNAWITEKSEKGFVINVATIPLEDAAIDWLAVW